MLLEDVAIDFPDMQIVIAHPSWPWQDEAPEPGAAQAQRLDRPVRLEPEVLSRRSWCSTPTRC
jgi:predicted TIM-barrel fold metal-dependent hydrolase